MNASFFSPSSSGREVSISILTTRFQLQVAAVAVASTAARKDTCPANALSLASPERTAVVADLAAAAVPLVVEGAEARSAAEEAPSEAVVEARSVAEAAARLAGAPVATDPVDVSTAARMDTCLGTAQNPVGFLLLTCLMISC